MESCLHFHIFPKIDVNVVIEAARNSEPVCTFMRRSFIGSRWQSLLIFLFHNLLVFNCGLSESGRQLACAAFAVAQPFSWRLRRSPVHFPLHDRTLIPRVRQSLTGALRASARSV